MNSRTESKIYVVHLKLLMKKNENEFPCAKMRGFSNKKYKQKCGIDSIIVLFLVFYKSFIYS